MSVANRAASATLATREDLAHRYVAAWNSHDPRAVASFFSDDAFYDDRGAGLTAFGRDAIEEHAAKLITAFPDLAFTIARVAHGGDDSKPFTLAEWTCRMTHLGELDGLGATGREVNTAGVDIATLVPATGQIRHLSSYYDGAGIMRELGILPGRGTGLERALTRVATLLHPLLPR